jgi:hypothetical protein
MKKGFNPTEKKTEFTQDLKSMLTRKTKELKNILRNPVVLASQLDKPKGSVVE